MNKNINKLGKKIYITTNGIEYKCCSHCGEYYPCSSEYFHIKTLAGRFTSRCKGCLNKSGKFVYDRNLPRVDHWDGELLICGICKVSKPEDKFGPDKRNVHRNYKSNSCLDCTNVYSHKRLNKLYTKNDLNYYITRLFYGISNRHKIKNKYNKLPFDIDKQYLIDLYYKQEGKCAISKIEMTHFSGKNTGQHYNNISVDRIIPNKGYTKENIQLVCTIINIMKHTLTMNELKEYCTLILQKNE